jgi:hypothetical protein
MADEKGAVLFHHGPYKGVQETAPIYAASLQHAIEGPGILSSSTIRFTVTMILYEFLGKTVWN